MGINIRIFKLLSLVAAFAAAGCAGVQSRAPADGGKSTNADSLARTQAFNHYLEGSIHEEAGELHQAALEYQVALLLDRNSAALPVDIARIYEKLNYKDAAIATLEAGRRSNPQDKDLLEALANLYIRAGRLDDAVDCYSDLAKERELSREELLRVAAIETKQEHYTSALNLYEQFLQRFPAVPDVYQKIGTIHLKRRDVEAAEKALKQVVALDSTAHQVQYVLGGFAATRKDWQDAVGYFRRAIAGDSSESHYWINYVRILHENGDPQDALSAAEQALERFPNIPQFHDVRASILQRFDRIDEAMQAIEESIAVDSTRFSPYMFKGFVHQMREEWDLAAQSYQHVLAIDPDNAVALNNFAYMLSMQNYRLEDALEMVNRALELSPRNPSYLDTRGWIYYRLARYKDALGELKASMKLSGGNAEIYAHLGHVYDALGERAKAEDAWRRAVELEPDNEEYRSLLDGAVKPQ